LIDDEFGAFYVASALFWLLVTVLYDVVRSRNNTNRQMPMMFDEWPTQL
jgi:hypothetical protein